MASIVILLIMAGCAAVMFLKGTFLRAFAAFMAALSAGIVAFAYFELLAGFLDFLGTWAQSGSFLLLFIVAFIALLAAIIPLTRQPVDFGLNPERAGRIVFGLLAGFIISGLVLTAGAIAPLSNTFPYQRFDPAKPDIQSPGKPLLNPDGFITRWFGIISSGSLGGSKSFAVLHADFLDQVYLDRLMTDKDVSAMAEPGAIELPAKAAAWPSPDGLKDNTGAPLSSKTGYDLIMVRIGITARALKKGGSFTTGQLRLICKNKEEKQRFKGSAVIVYPLGYLKSANQLQLKSPAELIAITANDVKTGTKSIDFAFYVPNGFSPVAVGFKGNIIAEVPAIVTAEEAPKPAPFIQSSNCETSLAKVSPATSAKIYGLELASGQRLLEGSRLKIDGRTQWIVLQTQNSISDARFDQNKIDCVQAELAEPNKPADGQPAEAVENHLFEMFKPASGYSLLSLKCNTPAARSQTAGQNLPMLIDSSGVTHHACGVIVTGRIDGKTTFEADFCPEKITFNNGAADKPFPENIWLTEKAEGVLDFYVLYMVKPGTVILSVQPAGSQTSVGFNGAECFLVN
jgi:hypothetical protein